jgi:hypothetical protein
LRIGDLSGTPQSEVISTDGLRRPIDRSPDGAIRPEFTEFLAQYLRGRRAKVDSRPRDAAPALDRGADPDGSDGLHPTIYRLRRRIERATPALVPLQSRSRVGHVLRAPLKPA